MRVGNPVSRTVWFIVGVLEMVLALRFIVLLLNAAGNAIGPWIISITEPLVAPFNTISSISLDGLVVPMATLVTMVVVWLGGLLVLALIELVNPRE